MGPSSHLLRDGRVFVINAFEPGAPPRLAGEDETISVLVCAADNLSCPEILRAIPARSPGASDCSQCSGTRWWSLPGQWSGPGKGVIFCLRCSGAGGPDSERDRRSIRRHRARRPRCRRGDRCSGSHRYRELRLVLRSAVRRGVYQRETGIKFSRDQGGRIATERP
jgi:hypothetical protein